MFEFKIGDIVRDYRFNKEFVLESNSSNDYPLKISSVASYTINGKLVITEDNPIITLVRRPKEKKSVTWYRVFYHYIGSNYPTFTTSLVESEKDLDRKIGLNSNNCHWIKLEPVITHEYEVENEK
jgi:hypothetical protein